MTRVQKLTERRREVNARLAEEDRKHRCPVCKALLPKAGAILVALSGLERYCSDACADEAATVRQ